METIRMKNPSEALSAFFAKTEWPFDVDDSRRCFRSHFSGQFGRWPFVAIVAEDSSGILVLSLLPAIAPVGRRDACLDLLNRANYQLSDGCFEMDPDRGQVRFRTSLLVPEEGVSLEAVELLIGVNLQTADHNFAAIMRVVYASQAPREALEFSSDDAPPRPRFELN